MNNISAFDGIPDRFKALERWIVFTMRVVVIVKCSIITEDISYILIESTYNRTKLGTVKREKYAGKGCQEID